MRFKIVCNFLKHAVFVNRSSRCRPSLCLSDVVCVAREFFSLLEQSTFCWQEAAHESSRFWWREACESIPTFHLFCLSCAMGKKNRKLSMELRFWLTHGWIHSNISPQETFFFIKLLLIGDFLHLPLSHYKCDIINVALLTSFMFQ